MNNQLIEKLKEAVKLELEDRGFCSKEEHEQRNNKDECIGLNINECLLLIQSLEKQDSMEFESALTYELSKLPYTKHLDDGMYNDGQIDGFEIGARWAKTYTSKQSDDNFIDWLHRNYNDIDFILEVEAIHNKYLKEKEDR